MSFFTIIDRAAGGRGASSPGGGWFSKNRAPEQNINGQLFGAEHARFFSGAGGGGGGGGGGDDGGDDDNDGDFNDDDEAAGISSLDGAVSDPVEALRQKSSRIAAAAAAAVAPIVVAHSGPGGAEAVAGVARLMSIREVKRLNFHAQYNIHMTDADEVDLENTSCEEEECAHYAHRFEEDNDDDGGVVDDIDHSAAASARAAALGDGTRMVRGSSYLEQLSGAERSTRNR